jgi:hypothetical protein
VAFAAADGRTEQSLEHAEVGLDLPSLPVLRDGPMVLEELTKEASRVSAGRLVRPTALGRNDPQHAQFVMEELMMVLGVIAHVGQQRIEGMSTVGLTGNAVELQVVRLGAAIDDHAEEQVTAGVNDRRQLRETMELASAPSAEVRRGVGGLQPGGIDGRQRAAGVDQAAPAGQVDGGVQEASRAPLFSSRRSA